MSIQRGRLGELIRSRAAAAAVIRRAVLEQRLGTRDHFGFRYEFRCFSPLDRRAVIQLKDAIAGEISRALDPAWSPLRLLRLQAELRAERYELAWDGAFLNLVPTGGADDILTQYFAGSAYTAAWYMGLVDGSTTPTFAATDTMASHSGWTENTAYSNAARPTLGFGTAASRSIALSAAATFNINATATVAGGFFTTVSTIGGTTGILYSAGAFTGGDASVKSGDTLSASASQSV
ncbi:MAG: hypothetical protein ACP5P4_08130 [Steroidobacteraceae bacterium]